MSQISQTIVGGDYEQAGAASRKLKEQLKRIGAAADVVRRAMIAAYEAEMNVVIHASGGTMNAVLADGRIDVEVADHGPGIADIPLAMSEGYSTAPPAARELGFGAGMGLPNIRRNADRFTIESTAGAGARVCFTIFLRPQQTGTAAPHSVRPQPGRCTGCLRCLHACPTRAIRLRPEPTAEARRCVAPTILDWLCVDCTSCLQACPAGALAVEGATATFRASADTVLVVPPAFVAQFRAAGGPGAVLATLRSLGFAEVRVTPSPEGPLRAAAAAHAAGQPADRLPVLSPVCPAALNLVATKFPALLDNVAPFLAPIESARESLAGRRVVFLALCPSQVTALQAGGGPAMADVILPATLAAAIRPWLAFPQGRDAPAAADSAEGAPGSSSPGPVLRVAGMRHVVSVLETVENGLAGEAGGPGVLELYACDEGCFGSPLLAEDACLSRRRWRQWASACPTDPLESPISRKSPLSARPGLRLDDDMASAIGKLAEIDRVLRALPGDDCGRCGCPTCATLAEDVVLGRATPDACVRLK